jgi:hypothetical protein
LYVFFAPLFLPVLFNDTRQSWFEKTGASLILPGKVS